MTDTPEDIRKTAAEVVEAMRVECHKERLFLGTVNACEVIRDFVAQALVEERERCAKIADEHTKASCDAESPTAAARLSAQSIAHAIRTP